MSKLGDVILPSGEKNSSRSKPGQVLSDFCQYKASRTFHQRVCPVPPPPPKYQCILQDANMYHIIQFYVTASHYCGVDFSRNLRKTTHRGLF